MRQGESRVGSNALFLLLQGLGGSVFGIIQIKLFTLSLGREGYSLFLVLRGLAVLLAAVAVLGLPQLAQRFLPQLETRGERLRILRAAGILLAGVLAAFVLVALAASRFWDGLAGHFAAVPGGRAPLLRETLLLALALGLAELVSGFYQGIRRMGPMALAELLGLTGLTLHLFLKREGLSPGLAMDLFSLWFLLRAVLLLLLLPWHLPRGGEPGKTALRIDPRQLLDYWLLSLPLRWLGLAYFELDRYVIGMVAALEFVALFHVPARLVGVSKRLLAAPVLSFQTEVSRFYEERRESELASRLQLFLRGQLAFSFWLAGAFFLLAKPLVLLVATADYLESLPLLALLLLTLPLGSLIAVLEAALRGLDGLRAVLLGNLLWALVYYCSLPWLIGRLGLPGLGLAQVAAALIQTLWVLAVSARRGWLRGSMGAIRRSVLWGALPLVLAYVPTLLLPGTALLSPSTPALVAGLVLLLLGALVVARGEGLFRGDEKRWLLARLPLPWLRLRLARMLRAEEVIP